MGLLLLIVVLVEVKLVICNLASYCSIINQVTIMFEYIFKRKTSSRS